MTPTQRQALNRDFSRRAVQQIQKSVRLAAKAGRQIAFGRPNDISPRKRVTMATQFDPSKPLSPDQAQGVLEQVAEVLGLTSWSDYDGMLQILEMLYQDTGHSHPDAPDDGSEKEVQEDSRDPHAIDHPVVDDDKQRPQRPGRPLPKPQKTLGLTPAQLKICKQQGCTPEAFLAAKRAIGGDQTHIAARLHRQGAAAAKVRR